MHGRPWSRGLGGHVVVTNDWCDDPRRAVRDEGRRRPTSTGSGVCRAEAGASDPFCRDIKRLSLILQMCSGRRHHAQFSVRYLLGQPIIGGSAVHLMPL